MLVNINLLKIWESAIFPSLQKKLSKEAKSINDKIVQSSFEFKTSPEVVFVNNLTNKEEIENYNNLQPIILNSQEEDKLQENLSILKQNPKFYDGDQMLIVNMMYDNQLNIIYLEARRCKFSILNTLVKKLFPKESNLYKINFYKVGVLVPFITKDDSTFFMERRADKFYSVAAGFLEPLGKEKSLKNIIISQAKNEALEEFLGDEEGNYRTEISDYTISSLSLRKTEDGIGSIEFIVQAQVNCYKSQLSALIETNQAKDKDEHTENFQVVPLDSVSRDETISFLKKSFSGWFLYHPIIASLVRNVNKAYAGDVVSSTLPYSRTTILPMQVFTQRVKEIYPRKLVIEK